jgi:RecB family exonuclease
VEREFAFTLESPAGPDRVRGRWDRVDGAGAEAVIIDYKSSDVQEPPRADRRAAESLQLKLYGLAWQVASGQLPARVELRFLGSGVTGRHVPGPDDADEAAAAVRAAAAGIRARRFEATPSYQACRPCAYNQVCPFTASRDS